MPFGLCNACYLPKTYGPGVGGGAVDAMPSIPGRCGRDFEEHLYNLSVVLQKLKETGLRLQPSKWLFCRESVLYLGQIVSREGVSTDPEKTAKVTSWPTPTSVQEVQQFMGLASYYRRFVRNFAEIARPLHT